MAPLDDRHLTTAGLVRGDFLRSRWKSFGVAMACSWPS